MPVVVDLLTLQFIRQVHSVNILCYIETKILWKIWTQVTFSQYEPVISSRAAGPDLQLWGPRAIKT
jgi:hypothetical protein